MTDKPAPPAPPAPIVAEADVERLKRQIAADKARAAAKPET
ncbi:MAG: hypothetical protein ACRCUI_05220 [Polymorphobacter sp.]